MSTNRQSIKNIVETVMKEEGEYKEFFKKALKKAGKSIPQMSDEEKKKFFNKIDKAWKGRKEKTNESLDESIVVKSIQIGKLIGAPGSKVEKFIEDNNLDVKKVLKFAKGDIENKMYLASAVTSRSGGSAQNKMIKQLESVNETNVTGTDLSPREKKGFEMELRKELGNKDTSAELVDTTNSKGEKVKALKIGARGADSSKGTFIIIKKDTNRFEVELERAGKQVFSKEVMGGRRVDKLIEKLSDKYKDEILNTNESVVTETHVGGTDLSPREQKGFEMALRQGLGNKGTSADIIDGINSDNERVKALQISARGTDLSKGTSIIVMKDSNRFEIYVERGGKQIFSKELMGGRRVIALIKKLADKYKDEMLPTNESKKKVNEANFKKDDLVFNKKTKTVGIVRLPEEGGEVKTDADGNVNVKDLEKYNPFDKKNHQNAKAAPSTKKEVDKRGLFKPFQQESLTEAQKINPKSKKFLKGMKKIKVKGLGGYMPGVDYIYVDGNKFYFVDTEGDHMELKNAGTIKQLKKLHGKDIKSESNINESTLKVKINKYHKGPVPNAVDKILALNSNDKVKFTIGDMLPTDFDFSDEPISKEEALSQIRDSRGRAGYKLRKIENK